MTEAQVIEAWPAARLTDLAVAWLRERHPTALILPEFVCGCGGEARVDVAAITLEGIFGVEIKGDGDTPARLATQGRAFSAVCTHVYLLASPNIEAKVQDKIPDQWGWLRVSADGAIEVRSESWTPGYYLAPQVLLNTLWRPELSKLITRFGLKVDRKRITVMQMIRLLVAEVPFGALHAAVCEALMEREWPNWKQRGAERRMFKPEPTRSASERDAQDVSRDSK